MDKVQTLKCFNNIITCLSLFLSSFQHNTPTRCEAFNMRTLFFIICHITTEILATIYIGSNCKKWVLWVLLIAFFPHMILKLCLLNALVVFKESGCINYLDEKIHSIFMSMIILLQFDVICVYNNILYTGCEICFLLWL